MKNIWKKIKFILKSVDDYLTFVNKELEEIRNRGFGPKS